MHNDSFTFGKVDMYEAFGVRVVHHDLLLPKLRPRKVIIPQRSGAFDFGAMYHDERILQLECDSRSSLTRAQLRELAYLMSKKNRIALWDEPDKYYIGRTYDPSEIEHIGEVVDEFTLTFTCDPYAYGPVIALGLKGGMNTVQYLGTAETPTRIEIRNTGETTATGVQITMTRRRDTN